MRSQCVGLPRLNGIRETSRLGAFLETLRNSDHLEGWNIQPDYARAFVSFKTVWSFTKQSVTSPLESFHNPVNKPTQGNIKVFYNVLCQTTF